MFSIGEFSKMTGLTVKALRYYHEQAILTPTHVDEQTGYRYYAASKIETARVIALLRDWDFPVSVVAEILGSYEDEADILDYLEKQKQSLQEAMQQYRKINRSLDQMISKEKEARIVMAKATFEVEEQEIDSLLFAGIRMKGKYSDCAQGFARLGKRFGRYLNGKPFLLHYDNEYKEFDADFEVCMPIRQEKPIHQEKNEEGISVRELPAAHCVTLLHQGPYGDLGIAYEKIMRYIQAKGLLIEMPTREVYLKGPGMIFQGNPKNYLTEIQMSVQGKASL